MEGFARPGSKLSGKIPEDVDLLMEYFHIFSKLFFLGTVTTANCKVEVTLKNSSTWKINQRNTRNKLGYATDPRPCPPSEVRSDIVLFELETEDPETRFISYLGELVHEIAHAFLCIFTCHCERKCRPLRRETKGLTGHGLPWRRCAKLIEDYLRKSIPSITLSRATSLVYELAWRRETSMTMTLQELGLEQNEVDRKIAHYAEKEKIRISEHQLQEKRYVVS